MLIGLLSDIHDGKDNLDWALAQLKQRSITEIITLGDYCSPPTIRQLASSGLTTHGIWGNNDGDRLKMTQDAAAIGPNCHFGLREFNTLVIDNQKIFITHYPEIAQPVAASGQFQAVFYGHDHKQHVEILDNGTLLANPGELWGHLTGIISFGVWDTVTNSLEIIQQHS